MDAKPTKITAILYGGPNHLAKMLVDKGTEVISFLGVTYTYAGRLKSRATAFALKPKRRSEQRWLTNFILKNGYDPRVEAHQNKKAPLVYTDENRPMKSGKGARKRIARRENGTL